MPRETFMEMSCPCGLTYASPVIEYGRCRIMLRSPKFAIYIYLHMCIVTAAGLYYDMYLPTVHISILAAGRH